MFVEYKFGGYKKEIRALLLDRIKLKARIRHHKKKIEDHKSKINLIESEKMVEVEKKLDMFLKRAGN